MTRAGGGSVLPGEAASTRPDSHPTLTPGNPDRCGGGM